MTPPIRRPFHLLTALGAVAHHGFELGAGVGLVFQPWLGLGGAGALWAATFGSWLAASQTRSRRWNVPLALAAGMSLGAVALHYVMWPWRWRGLPYLIEAEGLRASQLAPYNTVLWAWGAAAVAALAKETVPAALPVAAVGATTALAFAPSARRHFEWIREEAERAPAWWNRAFEG
jgi:hypothetical protein